MLPSFIKDFRLYINGFDTGSNVIEITMPKISEKMEEFKMGYFTLETAMGLEKLEAELTILGHDKNIWLQHGLLNNSTAQVLIFRAYQKNNGGVVDDIMVIMRGRFSEIDFGSMKTAEKNTHKIKASISAFTYSLNKIPYYVIEPLTNTFIIAGVNQLDKENSALGL